MLEAEFEHSVSESRYLVYSTKDDVIEHLPRGDSKVFDTLRESLGAYRSKVGKVGRLFQTMTAARWQGDKRHGKVNPKRLASLRTGNLRVFKQKQQAKDIDTAVTLLIDFSGSMTTKKMKNAMRATIFLVEVLKFAGVPCEVLGFSSIPKRISGLGNDRSGTNWSRVEPIRTMIVKEFDEVYGGKVKDRLGYCLSRHMSPLKNRTPVYDAMLVAYERLVRRREKRKMFFVLTDGQPSQAGDSKVLRRQTKEFAEYIHNETPVELVGLGFGSDVSKYFPECINFGNKQNIVEIFEGRIEGVLGIKP